MVRRDSLRKPTAGRALATSRALAGPVAQAQPVGSIRVLGQAAGLLWQQWDRT